MFEEFDIMDQLQDPETFRVRTRFNGLWKAIVEDNKDPEKRGRARMRVQQIYQNISSEALPWAEPAAMPYGGSRDIGFIFPPEVGSMYWVMFEQGDPDLPVYLGAIYGAPSGASEIPSQAKIGYPNIKEIKTASGHFIKFDDTPGKTSITIESASGHKIFLDDGLMRQVSIETPLGREVFASDLTQDAGMQTFVCRCSLSDITQTILITTPLVTIEANGASGEMTINTSGNINLNPSGSAVVKIGAAAMDAMVKGTTFKVEYDAHTHPDAQGGTTGPPTVPMTAASLSTKGEVE